MITGMQVLFLITAGVILFSSVMMVITHKMIHSALWFVLVLLGVAVIFALLEASFFAVVQVLVYVGAIAILIIFAVMLTRRAMVDAGTQTNKGWAVSLVIMLISFGGTLLALRTWAPILVTTKPLGAGNLDLTTLGLALVNPDQYALPFEITSILLLTALIGSIFIAFERKGDKK
jgi:NADH-quinone oxidoreductase subunit J